jgi:hypothetical protein
VIVRRAKVWVHTAVVVAAWYAVATTGAFYLAFDAFASRTKTVAVAAFPCARHACDCRNASQCLEDCCCFPLVLDPAPACPMHADAPEPSQPVTTNVAAIFVAACAGGTDDAGVSSAPRLQPHEASAAPYLPSSPTRPWTLTSRLVIPSNYLDVPEKIPISIS